MNIEMFEITEEEMEIALTAIAEKRKVDERKNKFRSAAKVLFDALTMFNEIDGVCVERGLGSLSHFYNLCNSVHTEDMEMFVNELENELDKVLIPGGAKTYTLEIPAVHMERL